MHKKEKKTLGSKEVLSIKIGFPTEFIPEFGTRRIILNLLEKRSNS